MDLKKYETDLNHQIYQFDDSIESHKKQLEEIVNLEKNGFDGEFPERLNHLTGLKNLLERACKKNA